GARAPLEVRDDDFGLQVDAPFTAPSTFFRIRAADAGRIVAAVETAATISGRVTREDDGAPVQNVSVVFFQSATDSFPMSFPVTGPDGRYTAIIATEYVQVFARTVPNDAAGSMLVHEAWPASQCSPTTGTSIFAGPVGSTCPQPASQAIVIGTGRSDIDFAIGPGALIGGRVTSGSASAPGAGATVRR